MLGSSTHRSGRLAGILSVLTALVLLIGGGGVYRVKEGYYLLLEGAASLPAGSLARLPMRLGDWQGEDVPVRPPFSLPPAKQVLSRAYVPVGERQGVRLSVGTGIRFRDLVSHRPEAWYPAAGWVLIDEKPLSVPVRDGRSLDCRLTCFQQAGLDSETITVLNGYVGDGRFCPDLAALQQWAESSGHRLRYVAQFQVTCQEMASPTVARQLATDFAQEAGPALVKLLEEAGAGISGGG